MILDFTYLARSPSSCRYAEAMNPTYCLIRRPDRRRGDETAVKFIAMFVTGWL